MHDPVGSNCSAPLAAHVAARHVPQVACGAFCSSEFGASNDFGASSYDVGVFSASIDASDSEPIASSSYDFGASSELIAQRPHRSANASLSEAIASSSADFGVFSASSDASLSEPIASSSYDFGVFSASSDASDIEPIASSYYDFSANHCIFLRCNRRAELTHRAAY